MKIEAAVLYEVGGPFCVETVDLMEPRSGEVLIQVAAAGVCHSDWHLVTGATRHQLPVVAGHEGAGVVAAVGPGVTRVRRGDHVALNWAPNCGSCFYCLHGRPSLCTTYIEAVWAGTMMDGSTRLSKEGHSIYHFSALACFATHTVVPEPCCVPIPKQVPLDVAALVGCAVTTGVGSVFNTAQVRPGASVVVFGAGGVGLSILMAARLAGASQVIAVDRVAEKRDMVMSFGATEFLVAGPETPSAIRTLTEGRGADYVFEAVGNPLVQEQCLDAVRPGGLIILVGISPMGSSTNLPGAILTRQEKTVTGSYYGTAQAARDFPLYLDLYARGQLDLDRLVTRTYGLSEINQAFADMLSGANARGVIMLT